MDNKHSLDFHHPLMSNQHATDTGRFNNWPSFQITISFIFRLFFLTKFLLREILCSEACYRAKVDHNWTMHFNFDVVFALCCFYFHGKSSESWQSHLAGRAFCIALSRALKKSYDRIVCRSVIYLLHMWIRGYAWYLHILLYTSATLLVPWMRL